jgi:hypothetical protein
LDKKSRLQGEGSLSELIAITRKALFERPPPTDKDQTVTTMQSQKWVPIKKSGSNTKEDTSTSGRGCKAVSFAADTNFTTREMTPVKRTPTKEAATKVNECVVKLQLKIFHGANNVQETVLGMMDHCLSILHERNKKARFVNKKKSLEAYKAMDFHRIFTDSTTNGGNGMKRCTLFLTLFQRISQDHSRDHFISGASGIQ